LVEVMTGKFMAVLLLCGGFLTRRSLEVPL
jgi:hypothetical protein